MDHHGVTPTARPSNRLVTLASVAALAIGTLVPTAFAETTGGSAELQRSQQEEPQEQQEDGQEEGEARPSEGVVDERVMVIGDRANLSDIPGSAHLLSREDLERHVRAFDDIHAYLRQVPGINIQEEDGYGLRPNIGMRGTGVERSGKITLMEDGVLIAPAPYASPSAYYFPVAGRMEGIEVRKGSSQIKYGPRTNGGALNLMSTSIPSRLRIRADVAGGSDRTGRAHVWVGDGRENFGWLLETYQISTRGYKELDGPRESTGFEIQDYLAKARFNTDTTADVYQEVEVKLAAYRQVSDETYLGLTEEDFRTNPIRRYAGSQEDVFRSDHQQVQARWFLAPTDAVDVTVLGYRNDFARNWYKLQSINRVGIADVLEDPSRFAGELAIAKGADSGADALKVRANNREYYSHGVQGIVGVRFEPRGVYNELEIGLRYHEDQEDRLQHEDGFRMEEGVMELTSRGAPGSQANRLADAEAWALFVQDQVNLGNWNVVPGVRYERVDLVRTDFATDDPDRTAPDRVRENELNVVIPGVGISYAASADLTVFGGIHKGFAPPGPGSTEETEAEESLNYELGLRASSHSASVELAAFYTDYANLLGADTLSAGGTGTGELFNGGQARVVGLEASGSLDLATLLDRDMLAAPVSLDYTFTDGEFRNSFDSDYEPWGSVDVGDELPYLPRHQVHAAVGLRRGSWAADLEAVYQDRMRTEAGDGPIRPDRGTDSYLVVNLSGDYRLQSGLQLFAGVQNLTDREYVVARRPAGARPGLPRTFTGGVRLDF